MLDYDSTEETLSQNCTIASLIMSTDTYPGMPWPKRYDVRWLTQLEASQHVLKTFAKLVELLPAVDQNKVH